MEVKFVKKQTGVTEPVFQFPNGDELEEIPFSYVIEYLKELEINTTQQYNTSLMTLNTVFSVKHLIDICTGLYRLSRLCGNVKSSKNVWVAKLSYHFKYQLICWYLYNKTM